MGLDFLSTPFDASSVEFLEDIGTEMYKIASYELTDIPLLKTVAKKGKPMLISTGMGDRDEIERAVKEVRACGNEQIILLKCTSEYPADFADMNLAVIPEMEKEFFCAGWIFRPFDGRRGGYGGGGARRVRD